MSKTGARLAGRVALVTGALGGIGAATAAAFAAESAKVWLADLDPIDAPRVGDVLAKLGGEARYLKLDVATEADWREAEATIRAAGQGLHILVNNAGIALPEPLATASLESWRRSMAVNADGTFLGIRTFRALLGESGAGAAGWSSIINISSVLGIVGLSGSTAYSASKGAIRTLTKAAAVELAGEGLPMRVNSIHPGFVRTPMTEQGSEEMAPGVDLLGSLAAMTPMRRVAHADEIAAGALFLASDESSFITGTELVIDGGWTAQ